MKKFNPEKELVKIQKPGFYKSSNFKGMFLPLLVITCSLLAIASASFSANLVGKTPIHTIEIEMINGPVDSYIKQVGNGPFQDKINTDATFGSIFCNEGSLEYDPITGIISNSDVRSNVSCVISYLDNGTKNISLAELDSVNDNTGTSYYFKGDSTNNYLKLNNTMFRIIRINGDGSLRVMLNSTYTTDILTEDLLNEITKWSKKFESYNVKLVQEDFDVSNYTLEELKLDTLIPSIGEYYSSAGLLSLKEAIFIQDGVENSYLGNNLLLSNFSDLNNVWVINDSTITTVDKNTAMNVKPVLNIKVGTLKGQGTEEIPYTLK